MTPESCKDHIFHDKKLEEHDKSIQDLYEKYNILDKKSAVTFERILTTLQPLPQAIVDLTNSNRGIQETMIKVQNTMVALSENQRLLGEQVSSLEGKINNEFAVIDREMDDMKDDIIEVDNKSKIDVTVEQRNNVRKNIVWPLCVTGGAVAVITFILEIIKQLNF